MLPKINRIKKKRDFKIIFKKGAQYKNNSLILKVIKNNFEHCRFAIITSQKVSLKATERNKIRRQIYSVIKNNYNFLKKGYDFVFIVLPAIKGLNFEEIQNKTLSLLKNV